MADPAVDIGTGTTITFGTSGFTSELLSISWSGIARESVHTSHMGTAAPGADKFGNRTFLPGDLADPGEITAEFHFDPSQDPIINEAAETITITFPSGSTWAASGFVTSFEFDDPMEDKMTATVVVKLSGNVTMTDST